ncbi:Bug family tripartite tricarboxylate transporter substrate binding protein [Paracoccus siganidrum]|uniref:Tricarboxylate transporter n=1 Tax=Paracoccus siganidrum TaxID=1276757 RepID=A0A419A4E7_9RHOB|nr:tripartite tricarboxylate transporter substrate-binding protein [Paracoccus siganidrum]RJL09341.1 tricarboxylate transporter [Paracoccus siganidrum]RMC39752.1 tricarboxylate transporter [Paracoccus siganidrum]
MRMEIRGRRIAHCVSIGVAAVLLGGAAGAQPDLSGQTVEWFIPFSETGGSDTWARFNAPYLQRHLPGNPQILIVNEPGGGSTRGANQFAQRRQTDGLAILGTSGSTQFPYLLGDLRVRYDYDDWAPVMIAPTGGAVYVSPELGIRDWRDVAALRDRTLIFASQGPTSLDLVPMLAFKLLGFDVRYVFGYTGRGDGLVAMQRDEVNIDYQTTPSYLRNVAPMVAAGEAVPVMSWGVLDAEGRVQRDPTFPDLPTVEEVHQLIHGAPPQGPLYDAYHVFSTAGFAAQKMVVVPKDTPEEIQQMWRETWQRVFDDPEYQAERQQVLGAYEQVTGEAARKLYEAGTNIAPEVLAHVLQMLADDYSVRLQDPDR